MSNPSSSILNLQTLQTQFGLAMGQYKQAFSSYASTISGPHPDAKVLQSYLAQIDKLNSQLIDLNSQISNVTRDLGIANKSVEGSAQTNDQKIYGIYSTLLEEKNKINQLLDEYKTLDSNQNESILRAESSHVYYRILIIVAIIIFIFIVRLFISVPATSSGMTGGGKVSFYDLLFNFIIIILLFFLAQSFQQSAGYILWSLFVLSYIVIKLKIFQKKP
jgi:hypothetical protein